MSFFPTKSASVLVHVSCGHPATRIDRFGDEVCRSCGQTVKSGVGFSRVPGVGTPYPKGEE